MADIIFGSFMEKYWYLPTFP